MDEKAQHYVSVTQSWDNTGIIIVSDTTLLPSSFIAKFVRGAAPDQKCIERGVFFYFLFPSGAGNTNFVLDESLRNFSAFPVLVTVLCVCVFERESEFILRSVQPKYSV